MSRHITVQLNEQSVQDAIDEIERYKESLVYKCTVLVSELQKIGIDTAVENVGKYGTLIIFEEQIGVRQTATGAKCCIKAKDAMKIISEWMYKGEVKTAEVSPLLMAEFGSGHYALDDANVPGVGQGTFPGQKHAFDPQGWWWVDPQGQKHHSKGQVPTLPMHKAIVEMREQIVEVARRVFADG